MTFTRKATAAIVLPACRRRARRVRRSDRRVRHGRAQTRGEHGPAERQGGPVRLHHDDGRDEYFGHRHERRGRRQGGRRPARSRQLSRTRVRQARERRRAERRPAKRSSPPARPPTPKSAASSSRCRRSNGAPSRPQHLRLTPVPGGESIGGNGTIPIPADVPEVVQKVIAGRERDRRLPVRVRRRPRVVRRQRL